MTKPATPLTKISESTKGQKRHLDHLPPHVYMPHYDVEFHTKNTPLMNLNVMHLTQPSINQSYLGYRSLHRATKSQFENKLSARNIYSIKNVSYQEHPSNEHIEESALYTCYEFSTFTHSTIHRRRCGLIATNRPHGHSNNNGNTHTTTMTRQTSFTQQHCMRHGPACLLSTSILLLVYIRLRDGGGTTGGRPARR